MTAAHIKDATLATVTAAAKLGEVHALVVGNNADGGRRRRRRRSPASPRSMSPTRRRSSTSSPKRRAGRGEADGQPRRLRRAGDHHRQEHRAARRRAARRDADQRHPLGRGPDTFTRPIYAGNAIATVKSKDAKKVITVRTTAFEKAAADGGSATVEQVDAGGDPGTSSFVGARSLGERAARADQRQGHRLGRPRVRLVRAVPRAARSARRQARRRRRREPRRGRRGLCAQRLSGRPDRQDRRSGSLYRDRHFRRDPAPRRA